MAIRENLITLESNKYSIKINDFEGPLDLLCFLVDSNKKDIYEISINEIADQYIEYINAMQEMDLEVTSEFLIMASNLLYLKSKKLLPKYDEEDEGELTEDELINQIIKYKQYKEITNTLRELFDENNKFMYGYSAEIELPKQNLEESHTSREIASIYKSILFKNSEKLNANAKDIEKIALTESYSIGESIKLMFKELIKNKHFIFNKLFSNKECSQEEVVTAFSGLLELSGRSKVTTKQAELFGDIEVNKIKRKKQR